MRPHGDLLYSIIYFDMEVCNSFYTYTFEVNICCLFMGYRLPVKYINKYRIIHVLILI